MFIKKTFVRLFSVVAVFVFCLAILAAQCDACYSIVVGKKASVDGCVIMAHNEDDGPPQIVNHHKIPRKKHSSGETVRLRNGGQLAQAKQTWAYIWSEMPGMLFSDSYLNEWGVCVTSDNCPSREDKAEITDGGIGYMLRCLVAQRAKTAREGVLLAGKLVERFGYIDSGRTYIICVKVSYWLESWWSVSATLTPAGHILSVIRMKDGFSVSSTVSTGWLNASVTMRLLWWPTPIQYAGLTFLIRTAFWHRKISLNMLFRGVGIILKRMGHLILPPFIRILIQLRIIPTLAGSGAASNMLLPKPSRLARTCPFQ